MLAIVAGLYVQHALSLLTIRGQAEQQLATVQRLAHANAKLISQQRSLGDPATIQQDARALGMVRQGERPYVITGMPGH